VFGGGAWCEPGDNSVKMSAWAKASERSVLKQPTVEENPLSPEATFQPQLVSKSSLREKVGHHRIPLV
jgi:hypothetical protein